MRPAGSRESRGIQRARNAEGIRRPLGRLSWLVLAVFVLAKGLPAQDTAAVPAPTSASPAATPDVSLAQTTVQVKPVAHDEEIRRRLQTVLEATKWFTAPRVRVASGIVFLEGEAQSEKLKTWAGDLARNTQDVVAVVNRLTIPQPSMWDFGPASQGVVQLWRDIVGALPSIAFGAIVLVLSLFAAVLTSRGIHGALHDRVRIPLLRTVASRAAGGFIFLLGIYVILRVMGLTQLALTLVGGTGLIGLAVGIAFRDITENFLASLFLSLQRPFEPADLIEVAGVTGYVQQLNMRTTVLMNLDGNVVQIPNATVYKSNLRNYTTNSNRREVFDIGIGYDDAIAEAQELARKVLADHPAVLDDPEPSVLVDRLGASTVNLRVYFWLNGKENSWLKVRSSVIRLVKREFQHHGVSMPDAAREIIFPQGVPMIRQTDGAPLSDPDPSPLAAPKAGAPAEAIETKAEGGLHSEAKVIEQQAKQARKPGDEQNLLAPAAAGDRPSPSA